MSTHADSKPWTVPALADAKREGRRLVMLTAYDAMFAGYASKAGVDILLVGDSLGMVIQGHTDTLPVTVADIAYHTACVARGNVESVILGDMPFGSYQASVEDAMRAAATLMQAGAHAVKLEGGAPMASTSEFLVNRGGPVVGHIGMTPQSVHAFGGFRVQGRSDAAIEQLKLDLAAVTDAGAAMVVLECAGLDEAQAQQSHHQRQHATEPEPLRQAPDRRKHQQARRTQAGHHPDHNVQRGRPRRWPRRR